TASRAGAVTPITGRGATAPGLPYRHTLIFLLSKPIARTNLQWCQLFTCFVVIEPRRLVPLQTAGPLAGHTARDVASAGPVQDQGQTGTHLGDCQRRHLLFSPDALPRSGTMSRSRRAPGGGATRTSSAPGIRSALPHSCIASGIPQSDAWL